MYPNNIMPNYNRNIQNYNYRRRNDNRFFGGGFAVPFLLGGITGGLLARPNNYPVPAPFPVPYPYYVNNGYPYTYSENYYYY